jgi:hypothetical protein
MGYPSLTAITHPPNVSVPSSGQQSTSRLSPRRVSAAGGNRAQDPLVRDTTLRPLGCWDCGFEYRQGMDVCLLWRLCCVDTGLWTGLITRPQQSYPVSRVSLSVIPKPRQWGGPGPTRERCATEKRGGGEQIMKLLIVQSPPVSCHLVSLRPKYLPH